MLLLQMYQSARKLPQAVTIRAYTEQAEQIRNTVRAEIIRTATKLRQQTAKSGVKTAENMTLPMFVYRDLQTAVVIKTAAAAIRITADVTDKET